MTDYSSYENRNIYYRKYGWVIDLANPKDIELIEGMIRYIPIFNQSNYIFFIHPIPDLPNNQYRVQPYYQPVPEVESFLDFIFEEHGISIYNESKWINENTKNDDPEKNPFSDNWIQSASLDSLIKAFSYARSSDRFVTGYISAFFERGFAVEILQQIKSIYESYNNELNF